MKIRSAVVLGVWVVFMLAPNVRAQTYPNPTEQGTTPPTFEGLPTVQYTAPIKAFAGRYVDSTVTADYQCCPVRTYRAKKVRVVDNGSVSRVYMIVGETFMAYNLSTFLSSTLTGPMDTVSRSGGGEKYRNPAAYVYPEKDANWQTNIIDHQQILFDFDWDDRGNVYLAYEVYGWGIVHDSGSALIFQSQRTNAFNSVLPKLIRVFRTGSNYYALVSDGGGSATDLWNVTDTTNPTLVRTLPDQTASAAVASSGGTTMVALKQNGTIEIYRASDLVAGAAPSTVVTATSGSSLGTVTTDGTDFWVSEKQGLDKVHPVSAGSTTYSVTRYTTSQSIVAPILSYGDGKIAAIVYPTTGGQDLALYDVSGGSPSSIDLHEYFLQYYSKPPSGYAKPSKITTLDASVAKLSGSDYIFYSAKGLGDAYELDAADHVTLQLNPSAGYGTANPKSTTSADRPFYGDPIPLKSAYTGTSAPSVNWNFGNPEAGSANTKTTSANTTLSYQYAGIGTIASSTLTKTVTITNTTNGSDTDSAAVTMKRPSARVLLGGTSLTFPGSSIGSADIVPGDTWYDASDGSIESHYDVWGPDPNDPNSPTATSAPGTGFDVGSCGTHTLAFQPHYIPYDSGTLVPVSGTHYLPTSVSQSYEVRPFWAAVAIQTSDPNSVTFENAARIGPSSIFASGTSTPVTIDWTLKNGATVVDTVTHSSTIGAAANDTWQVNKSAIGSGYTVDLTMSVAPGASSVAACDTTTYQTSSAEMTLNPPDPKINVSGCGSVGAGCTLSGTSSSGADTSGWSWSWSISPSGFNPSTSSLQSFSPSISAADTYTVTLTASNALGQASVNEPLEVTAPVCGPGLNSAVVYFTWYGVTDGCSTSPCSTVQDITFSAKSAPGYTFQSCDNFNWNFGDGSTDSGQTVTHTFPGNGPYVVKVTVSNSTGESAVSGTSTIQFGAGTSCPTVKPSSVAVNYSGPTSGCAPSGVNCQTFEYISFSTSGYSLQSCDNVSWNFGDGSSSTSRTPTHRYTTTGSKTVTLTVSNSLGNTTATKTITVDPGSTGACAPGLANADGAIVVNWTGEAGCTTSPCANAQPIDFSVSANFVPPPGYAFQACDVFTWDFGDGSAQDSTSGQNVTHSFPGAGSYTVNLTVSNSTGESAAAGPVTIQFGGAAVAKPTRVDFNFTPASPIAGITVVNFSGSQSGGDPATSWKWTFGDGSGQVTGQNVTHTFANPGTFTVTLAASNGGGSTTASKTVSAVEDSGYSFMIPAVIHSGGANGSVWRSDFQAYVPNVSASNPLTLNLQFNGCVYTTPTACTATQINKTMVVNSSTFVVEDFMASQIDSRGGSGSVIVTGNSPDLPQIWTRTYNLAPSGVGTYGQLVPAVLLSSQQNSLLSAPELNIGGLQQSTRYRTNLGFVNPNGTAITLTVHVFDKTGFEFGSPFNITLSPYQLDQRPMAVWYSSLPQDIGEFSLRIDNASGLPVIGYASQVDNKSNDPVYIPAISDSNLSTEDSRDLIIPSVGHFNTWRSDISIFNPDSKTNSYDISYYDQSGALQSQLLGVTIAGKGTLGISDVLKAGQLLPVVSEDSIGEIVVHSNLNPTVFPEVFGRTYSDQGTAGTFGYASPAFSAGQPNVVSGRPAYVPGVRNDAGYYTNLGLISLNGTDPTTVLISMLDPTGGVAYWTRPFTLDPFASTIIPSVISNFLGNTMSSAKGTLKIEIISGGPVWSYATVIDKTTADPEYVPAVPAN